MKTAPRTLAEAARNLLDALREQERVTGAAKGQPFASAREARARAEKLTQAARRDLASFVVRAEEGQE